MLGYVTYALFYAQLSDESTSDSVLHVYTRATFRCSKSQHTISPYKANYVDCFPLSNLDESIFIVIMHIEIIWKY